MAILTYSPYSETGFPKTQTPKVVDKDGFHAAAAVAQMAAQTWASRYIGDFGAESPNKFGQNAMDVYVAAMKRYEQGEAK